MVNNYPKKYFPNLDATRFIAFLAVFMEHMIISNDPRVKASGSYSFYQTHFHLASLGVGFFIVLSGFLITWIILEEYKFTSVFDLSFFWVKRTLRIWPLYFLLVAAAYVLVWVGKEYTNVSVHDMPSFIWLVTFTLNFYIVNHGQAFLFFIVFLWSISVEEQLYVVWGLVLKYLRQFFVPFCLLLLLASLLFRLYFIHDNDNLYFNTLNWAPHFALGGLIAYISINGGKLFERLKALPRITIISIYLLFIIDLAFYNEIYSTPFMTVIQRIVDASFFAFFIFEQTFCDDRLFNLSKSKNINYLGKISYGLFCYHGLVILFFTEALQQTGLLNNSLCVFIIDPLLIFAITVLISATSYKYFEKPFMGLRNKLKSA